MLCPKCARAISLDYGNDKCPHCGESVGNAPAIKKTPEGLHPPASSQTSTPATPDEYADNQPTWDDDGPIFIRFWNTLKNSMLHPMNFFSRIPVNAGLGRPLLYTLIAGFIGVAGAVFW